MQPFVRRTLSWKYAAYFAGLVSLLLAVSGALGGYFAYRESVAALEEVQLTTARYAAREIAGFMRRVRDALNASVSKFDPELPDMQDLRTELEPLWRQHPEISVIRYIGADGKERFSVSRSGITVTNSGRDWFDDPEFLGARNRLDYVGPVRSSRADGPYVSLGVARSVDSGVFQADVNLAYIRDLMAQADLKSGSVAYVVDREGRLVSHPEAELVLARKDMSGLPHIRKALEYIPSARVLTGEARDVHGQAVVSIAEPVDDTGWTVFAEQSLQEAYRPVYASIGRSVGLVLLGIAAAVAASVLLARRMVRPIREIEMLATKLGVGRLDQRIALRTGDELDGLATQFNRMAERLQETHAMQETRIAERTRDLAVANEAKTRFIAAASHDLRQPIQALSLFVGQLRTIELPDDAAALAHNIERSVDALGELLEALLDLSKLDVGAVHAECQALPLQGIFSRLALQFRAPAKAKGLALTMVGTSLWVHSDPLLLERIMLNLVANAIRYTAHGRILIGCRRRGEEVEVIVADTGIGIEPAHLPHVFQEFYRAPTRGRGLNTGLGLGLAIVKRLALLLDHRVDIASVPSRGTVVRIFMPRATPMRHGLSPRSTIADSLRGKRVLVVDDEAPIREAMEGLLSRWGCEVVVAATAEDAIAHARWRRPDAVLCDLNLSQGDSGIHVVEALQRECGPGLACAFVTGESSPDRLAQARAIGYPLLLKPTSAGKLRAMIEHLAGMK